MSYFLSWSSNYIQKLFTLISDFILVECEAVDSPALWLLLFFVLLGRVGLTCKQKQQQCHVAQMQKTHQNDGWHFDGEVGKSESAQ